MTESDEEDGWAINPLTEAMREVARQIVDSAGKSSVVTRRQLLEREAQRHEERASRARSRLEALSSFPERDPYEDGQVIRFERRADRRTYTYVALRQNRRWWTTSTTRRGPMNWLEFVEWLLDGECTSWTEMDTGQPVDMAYWVRQESRPQSADCSLLDEHEPHTWEEGTRKYVDEGPAVSKSVVTRWCPGRGPEVAAPRPLPTCDCRTVRGAFGATGRLAPFHLLANEGSRSYIAHEVCAGCGRDLAVFMARSAVSSRQEGGVDLFCRCDRRIGWSSGGKLDLTRCAAVADHEPHYYWGRAIIPNPAGEGEKMVLWCSGLGGVKA